LVGVAITVQLVTLTGVDFAVELTTVPRTTEVLSCATLTVLSDGVEIKVETISENGAVL
jgi:hypothetical protein